MIMKKTLPLLAFLCISISVLFTSCDDEYGYPGGNYEPALIGTWELYKADGVRVGGYQVNWMQFDRGGRGTYYYYNNATPYSMWFDYYVDWYYDSSVLYIDYQDGSSVSMDYWFNSNGTMLYTQWYDHGYRHIYCYRYVSGPYDMPALKSFAPAAEHTPAPAFAPGLSGLDKATTPVFAQ